MLTFYFVVTAFLTGIAVSHRPDDLRYIIAYGTPEEKIMYFGGFAGLLAFIILWPIWMCLGLGFLIHQYTKTYLKAFKRA